jgi:hypothetical protein
VTDTLRYAFIDETGNVAFSRQNHCLIIVALCTESPRSIDRIIRKMQKRYGSSLASGELKAKKADSRLVKNVLTLLAQEPIEVFAIVVDQRMLENPPDDAEEIYRWTMARLVQKLVRCSPSIEIILDRRYTKAYLRYLLEKAIRKDIYDLPQQYVLIRQEDSVHFKELQAVDFIAWALFQKFERANDSFYRCILPRFVNLELVSKQVWDQTRRNEKFPS